MQYRQHLQVRSGDNILILAVISRGIMVDNYRLTNKTCVITIGYQ